MVVPPVAASRLPPQKRSAVLEVGVAVSWPLAMRRKLFVLRQLVPTTVPKLAPLVGGVPVEVTAPLNQKGTPPFDVEQGVKHNLFAFYSSSFHFSNKRINYFKNFFILLSSLFLKHISQAKIA